MAESNRVSVPRELIPHLKAEAESLFLSDDLTAAVCWILRKHFRDKCKGASPSVNPISEVEIYDDLFTK